MQISPASEPDDGALDVLVMVGPKSGAFTALPRAYRGTCLPYPDIAALRAGRLRVDADPPFDIEADGRCPAPRRPRSGSSPACSG